MSMGTFWLTFLGSYPVLPSSSEFRYFACPSKDSFIVVPKNVKLAKAGNLFDNLYPHVFDITSIAGNFLTLVTMHAFRFKG